MYGFQSDQLAARIALTAAFVRATPLHSKAVSALYEAWCDASWVLRTCSDRQGSRRPLEAPDLGRSSCAHSDHHYPLAPFVSEEVDHDLCCHCLGVLALARARDRLVLERAAESPGRTHARTSVPSC